MGANANARLLRVLSCLYIALVGNIFLTTLGTQSSIPCQQLCHSARPLFWAPVTSNHTSTEAALFDSAFLLPSFRRAELH